MTSTAHQSNSRAVSPQLGSAIGRGLAPTSSEAPATYHKPQMATHSRGWGVPLWNSCAFPPAARQDRPLRDASGLGYRSSLRLGRGLRARGPFSNIRASIRQNRCNGLSRPTERNRSSNHSLSQGADQLSHFKDLNFVGHQPTKRGIHRVGTFTQGLGND